MESRSCLGRGEVGQTGAFFSRVQNGKSILKIGCCRNQTVPETEGYFVRKESPSPKTTEVAGILSIAFHGSKSLFNSGW